VRGGGQGCPPLHWEVSRKGVMPPPQKILMVCFGVFCDAKFNILVTTKSCKNHTLNARGTRADVTKRNKHLWSFFLTSPINTNQSNPVSPSVTCLRDRNPLRVRYCDILSQKQTHFFSFILYNFKKSVLNTVSFCFLLLYSV